MKIELESEKLLGYRLYSEDGTTGEKCGGKRGDKGGGNTHLARSTKIGGMAGAKDGNGGGGFGGKPPM